MLALRRSLGRYHGFEECRSFSTSPIGGHRFDATQRTPAKSPALPPKPSKASPLPTYKAYTPPNTTQASRGSGPGQRGSRSILGNRVELEQRKDLEEQRRREQARLAAEAEKVKALQAEQARRKAEEARRKVEILEIKARTAKLRAEIAAKEAERRAEQAVRQAEIRAEEQRQQRRRQLERQIDEAKAQVKMFKASWFGLKTKEKWDTVDHLKMTHHLDSMLLEQAPEVHQEIGDVYHRQLVQSLVIKQQHDRVLFEREQREAEQKAREQAALEAQLQLSARIRAFGGSQALEAYDRQIKIYNTDQEAQKAQSIDEYRKIRDAFQQYTDLETLTDAAVNDVAALLTRIATSSNEEPRRSEVEQSLKPDESHGPVKDAQTVVSTLPTDPQETLISASISTSDEHELRRLTSLQMSRLALDRSQQHGLWSLSTHNMRGLVRLRRFVIPTLGSLQIPEQRLRHTHQQTLEGLIQKYVAEHRAIEYDPLGKDGSPVFRPYLTEDTRAFLTTFSAVKLAPASRNRLPIEAHRDPSLLELPEGKAALSSVETTLARLNIAREQTHEFTQQVDFLQNARLKYLISLGSLAEQKLFSMTHSVSRHLKSIAALIRRLLYNGSLSPLQDLSRHAQGLMNSIHFSATDATFDSTLTSIRSNAEQLLLVVRTIRMTSFVSANRSSLMNRMARRIKEAERLQKAISKDVQDLEIVISIWAKDAERSGALKGEAAFLQRYIIDRFDNIVKGQMLRDSDQPAQHVGTKTELEQTAEPSAINTSHKVVKAKSSAKASRKPRSERKTRRLARVSIASDSLDSAIDAIAEEAEGPANTSNRSRVKDEVRPKAPVGPGPNVQTSTGRRQRNAIKQTNPTEQQQHAATSRNISRRRSRQSKRSARARTDTSVRRQPTVLGSHPNSDKNRDEVDPWATDSLGGQGGFHPTSPLKGPVSFHAQAVSESDGTGEDKTSSKNDESANAIPKQPIYIITAETLQEAQEARAGQELFWQYDLFRGPEGKQPLLHYCRSKDTVESVAQLFANEKVLGFDLEWAPNASKHAPIKDQVSLIQLASEQHIALFHIALHRGAQAEDFMAPTLKSILESHDIIKCGVSVRSDCTRLDKWLGIKACGTFELSHLYKLVKYGNTAPEQVNKSTVGLAAQVLDLFGMPLSKGEVRYSAWNQELKSAQCKYAATDAYAGYQLFHELERRRLAMRPTPPRPAFAERGQSIKLADGITVSKPPSVSKVVSSGKIVDSADQQDDTDGDEQLRENTAVHHSTRKTDDPAAVEECSSAPPTMVGKLLARLLPGLKSPSTPSSVSKSELHKESRIHIPEHEPCAEGLAGTSDHEGSADSKRHAKGSSITAESPSELLAANGWASDVIAQEPYSKEQGAKAYQLRAYHLWHIQGMSVTRIADLRKPPWKTTTIAAYILEVVQTRRMSFDEARLKEVIAMAPPSQLWRYQKIIHSVKQS